MHQPPEPPPLQSIETADALYTRVLARGRRLRRERRAFLATAAMSFVLLAAAVPVALTNDDGSQVATTDRTRPTRTSTTSTTATPQYEYDFDDATTTTLAPVPVVEGTAVTPTTQRRSPITTRRPTSPTSTPPSTRPPTTVAPATTTTTAVPSSPPATPCEPSPSLVVTHPQIAFVRAGDIHVVNADGSGTPVTVRSSEGIDRAPTLSPLGDRIAFQAPEGIAVVDVTGANFQLRTSVAGDSAPAWSPDGAVIAFVRGGNIYTVPADGGPATKVLDLADPLGFPSFSPDSCRLAFTWRGGVLQARRDGTGIRSVRSNASEPDWGPDGRLAVTAVGGSRDEVFLVQPDGSGFDQVTLGGASDPSWSGEGDAIAFEAPNRDGGPGIYTQRADKTGLTRVTTEAGDSDPAW